MILEVIASVVVAAPTVVWSTEARVSGKTPGRFQAKGLTPGTLYNLVTRGTCEVRDTPRRKRWRERVNPSGNVPFGTGFRVFVPGEDYPIGVDDNRHLFRAHDATIEVRVEDQSSGSNPRTICRVTFVAIETID
ncbi:MAG: hypothetical protein SFW67_01340 [Myxococcaceae bacterium]|nr:hypothetical protein [Myxococcaceae bacterium]